MDIELYKEVKTEPKMISSNKFLRCIAVKSDIVAKSVTTGSVRGTAKKGEVGKQSIDNRLMTIGRDGR